VKFLLLVIGMFLLYITSIRLLGKTALAQLTPHDFGAIIFLAYIACAPITNLSYKKACIAIIALVIVHLVISKLNLINRLTKFIIGNPVEFIQHGKINISNLKKQRYPLSELLSAIRTAGFPSVDQIEYAILEPNGNMSVIPKPEYAPLSKYLLHSSEDSQPLPISLILEGKIQHQQLKKLNRSNEWLMEQLRNKGVNDVNNVFYAYTLGEDGPVYVQLINEHHKDILL
jgi:uncharacterized membrane protein YcaP (DUF421 family)